MNIKTIFWDLGNVLFKIRIDDFLQAILNKGSRRCDNQDKIGQIITLSFNGKISLDETVAKLAYLTGCKKDTFYEIMELDWIIANNELIDFIISISSCYNQGIISDLWHIPYYWIQKRYQKKLQVFAEDLTIFSNLTGFTKRDNGKEYLIGIFKKLNLQPDTICLVDDDIEVIKVAGEIGTRTIRYPKVYLINQKVDWQEANQSAIKKLEQILH